MKTSNFWLSKEVMLAAAFTVLITVPFVVFGGNKVIYVDKDNSGTEDGSNSHPYRTISRALKHADGGTEVRIKSGTYKENITIPKDVKVLSNSEDADKVTIKGDNGDLPVVIMKDDAKLSYVTIKNGFHGVRINEDANAHLFKVEIKNNKRDGIHIDKAPTKKKFRVMLDKVKISNNGRAGIFSEKRFIVIVNSDITSNRSDGIDLAAGTEAWLENNRFNDNKGSGAKLIMDGAEIWTKKNSFRNNSREGVEISSFGLDGKIGFKKASFVGNHRYGITKLARTGQGLKGFSGLFLGEGVNIDRFEKNLAGNISAILRGF
ncbi:MAG: right-handed parallel beta-helix repeat-containing protein [Candidatus Moranbacteria bacterium]|nr:right-handed parallel beta-helix repeat-containing protein [Candidatus Moranbacteria bacterium]